MEENVTQINSGITINVDVSVKNIIYVKKIIFGIVLHVVANCSCSIMYDSAITCDEIIDVEGKSNNEETKTITTNFNEKNITCNIYKTSIFYLPFY